MLATLQLTVLKCMMSEQGIRQIFPAPRLETSNNDGTRTHDMTIYHDSIDDSSTGSGEVRATCVPRTIGWRENLFRFS